MADYNRAANYYAKHSDANTIRKIQIFLTRFYPDLEVDGKFGKQTFDAIVDYQNRNHIDADGMWGESTNSIHRVLNASDAPYRNDTSGPSGAHASQMMGVNTGRNKVDLPPTDRKRYI